ncbi:hypothetical protein BDU57DRAFT_103476 [Ampelomyces quisqualis]|uniref:Uncharacterized protein n=1 Tax=Ampelomyces quisqualis TaxID=50730 RepID=A0A6A5Q7B2_AMPQU|nr:hypothetical protein BDU57DRAFT_103476 [Ampelomyces quisqualis]
MLSNIQSHQRQIMRILNTSQQSTRAEAVTQYSATSILVIARERAALSSALRAFLSQRRDLIGFMNEYSYSHNAKAFLVQLRAGPAIVKNWSREGKSIRKAVPWEDGACLVLILQTLWPFSRHIDVMISYTLVRPQMHFGFSLTTYGVLQKSHPAVMACKSGDWPMLRQLLQEKKVGIFDKTVNGTSLLHVRPSLHVKSLSFLMLMEKQMAVYRRHRRMILGLMENGAQLDAADIWGRTPLILAISLNCGYHIAKLLLAEGADLYHQDDSGRTVLHQYFADTGRAILIFHQDDIDFSSQDSLGRSVAPYVCLSSKSRAVDLSRCHKNDPKWLFRTDNYGDCPSCHQQDWKSETSDVSSSAQNSSNASPRSVWPDSNALRRAERPSTNNRLPHSEEFQRACCRQQRLNGIISSSQVGRCNLCEEPS